jgi:hypothetical protein
LSIVLIELACCTVGVEMGAGLGAGLGVSMGVVMGWLVYDVTDLARFGFGASGSSVSFCPMNER